MSGLSRIDAALIEAAKAGDAAALDRLLAVSQPDLRRFARRTCATAEDADDAVQAALWQLHRRIGTLRVVAAFARWLFRIVERECRRLFGLTRPTVSLDDVPAAQLGISPVPVGLRHDLGAMIAALPDLYREVLILRDIEELTAPEAAAQLGVSVDAVKSRLHRARFLLREKLLASGYWTP
jgi:DNA-directed RNA polymerase specialized sigma24 family protein